MKFNEIFLIITQLPEALISSDADVDYHVAHGITGTSVVEPLLLYTSISLSLSICPFFWWHLSDSWPCARVHTAQHLPLRSV